MNLLLRPEVRLVTLTGPGGTGKTRLSLAVGQELVERFPQGLFFVDLSPISDPALVATTIAHTMGVREGGGRPPIDNLKRYLYDKEVLLLLDNLEQIITAAPVVAELLAAAPKVKVMATSRIALNLRGEWEYPVDTLRVPPESATMDVVELLGYEAVQLFVQQAQAVRPSYELMAADAAAVAGITRRLDGLPLAIEIAAARTRMLPPRAVLKRLHQSLKLLVGGAADLPARQQTLRSTIDWSYNLLEPDEQTLFARLSVFVGGFTLESAEAVVNSDGVLDLFSSIETLLANSLLRRVDSASDEPRIDMLQTIREYAREKLVESGEAVRLHQRHAQAFLALAELAAPALQGPDQLAWFERLEMEHDNLRAALTWIQAAGSGEDGLRLTAALSWFWYVRGYESEGRRWLESALEQGADAAIPLRVTALNALAGLELHQEDFKTQRAHLEKALALARSAGDKRSIANSLYLLGHVMLYDDDLTTAFQLTEESLALARELGDGLLLGRVLWDWAQVLFKAGDLDRARAVLEESLMLLRERGDLVNIAAALYLLGEIVAAQGDLEQAAALYHDTLVLLRRLNFKQGHAWLLKSMGELAWSRAEYDEAAELLAMSLDLFRELGEKFGAAVTLYKGGYVALHQGILARAEALLEEGLALYQEFGNRWGIAHCLAGFGALALARAQPEQATRLLGAASALLAAIDHHLEHPDSAVYDDSLAKVRDQLDEAAFAAAWAEGQAMTMEEAIACATTEDAQR
jgi:predicted ATPase